MPYTLRYVANAAPDGDFISLAFDPLTLQPLDVIDELEPAAFAAFTGNVAEPPSAIGYGIWTEGTSTWRFAAGQKTFMVPGSPQPSKR